MKEKVSRFSNNRFQVYVSSGPKYSPIQITVHEFYTRDQSFLFFKKVVTDDVSKVSTFIEAYSPPLAIVDLGLVRKDLSGKLTDHIQEIIGGERNYGEVSRGNTSQLTWDVYEAVRLYQRANPTVGSRNLFRSSISNSTAIKQCMNREFYIGII